MIAICGTRSSLTRYTDRRKAVTCKRCQAMLRRWFPRLRSLPMAKRKIHFYSLQYDTPAARCGIRDHKGLITGKMANITCGRCIRVLGLNLESYYDETGLA